MKSKKLNEVFKSQETELQAKFEKDGYNWEQVKRNLEQIAETEKIDDKLNELEGRTEDTYNYFKGLLEKQAKSSPHPSPEGDRETSSSTKAEGQKNEKGSDSLKEKAKKKVIEEAEKKGGFYGKIARFFLEGTEEKKDDSFFTKIWNGMKVGIGLAVLGWFGIKGIELSKAGEDLKNRAVETVKDAGNTVKDAGNTVIDSAKNVVSTVVPVASAEVPKTENKEENTSGIIETGKGVEKAGEILKNKYSSTGLLVLKSFSIEKYEAQDTTDLFSKFQNQKFSDLQERFSLMDDSGSMRESEVQKFKNETPGLENYSTKDIYNILKIFFATKTTNIIFKERLSKQNIENIINSIDGKKLDKILGEQKVEEIKNKNYNFAELDLKTITTLLGLSYKGFIGSSILEGFEIGKNFFNDLFFGANSLDIFNELKSEIEERKNNLLPISVYESLKGESGINFGGSQKVDIKISDLDTSNFKEGDLEKLKKFLSFRDTILAEFRNPSSKFALGLPNFRENFDKAINLKEIIYLYLAFDGNTSFLNGKDSVVKSGVYIWLYKLFDGNNQTKNFAGSYVAKIESELREGKEYFSEDEKVFVNVIFYKVVGFLLKPYIDNIKKAEGFVNQKISEFLIGRGVSEQYANELAYLIEGAGGLITFFALKRLKVLRFAIVPLVPAIGLFLYGSYNEFVFKNQISKEQYEEIRKNFNDFLAEEKPKVNIDGKEIIVNSLDDLEKAKNNATEVIENQRKFEYFIIENGKARGINRENISKIKNEVFLEINSSGYNIFYKNNKYRIKNSYELPDFINGQLPDSYSQKKFTNPHLSEDFTGINFGSGADIFKISFNEIVNAFKKGENSDGDYTLIEDFNSSFDAILKKQ